METVTDTGRLAGAEQGREQRKGRQEQTGRAAGYGMKRSPLVEVVSEYWEVY